MPTDRDPNAIRLPDDVAQRLLARATELDERNGRTSIDQLRRAATEAGISPAAFEAALAELARGELGRPAAATAPAIDVRGSWVTSPFRRGLLVAAAALAAILIAVGAVRNVTVARESPAVPVEVDVDMPVDVAPAAPLDVELVPEPPAPEAPVPPTEATPAPPPAR
jgi:hypothetical protein